MQGESTPDQTWQAAHSRSILFSPATTAFIVIAVSQPPKRACGKSSDHCRRSRALNELETVCGRRIDYTQQQHVHVALHVAFGLHHVLGLHNLQSETQCCHRTVSLALLNCFAADLIKVQPATKAPRAISICPTWARITVHCSRLTTAAYSYVCIDKDKMFGTAVSSMFVKKQ